MKGSRVIDLLRVPESYELPDDNRFGRKAAEDRVDKRWGNNATKNIQLSELHLSPNSVLLGLRGMEKLTCLHFETDNDVLIGGLAFEVTPLLRFLLPDDYPVRSLRETIRANYLVELALPDSKITQLWEGGERPVLNNLRFLDLSRSMLTTLDLDLAPRLVKLELKECHDLVDILTPVGSLTRLSHLGLIKCSRFDSVSFMKRLESLGVLFLSNLDLEVVSPHQFSREISKASSSGLKSLQKQVLSIVLLADEGFTINSVSEGKNMIKEEMGDRKVLVFLDYVDQIEQLAALAGAPSNRGKIYKSIPSMASSICQLSIPSMASSSTSSIYKSFKYDVFLSFRSEDTCETFVELLYSALQRQGTHTCIMEQGRKIDDEVVRSIQDSRSSIIVFSQKYASSPWCLDELVKIMECHKTTEHTVYPVFYDVEPSEVCNQIGADGEDAGKWRKALQEATNLPGWEMGNTGDGDEAKLIEKIVEGIWCDLRSVNVYINKQVIGIGPRLEEVLSSLEAGAGDVCIIGITGVRGVGKTTLARTIFERYFRDFEGTSFVENVRESSKASSSGLKSLQKQVLSDVLLLADEGFTINSVSEGKNMIEEELGDRKVLVVLDDVDQIEQLAALAGAPSWFGKGSIIIITTRDEDMLLQHGVKQIHRVSALPEQEAICLLSWFAFGGCIPVEGYEQLSLEAVHCAACLPLAIKVLGSFLRGKSKHEWRDVLQRLSVISLDEGLKLISFKQTLEILKLSFNSLDDDVKEIFLDVACYMKGFQENDAIRILESCGLPARRGLRVLERKSLLTISADHRLGMHGFIEYMGRDIVRGLHPEQPNQHTRLWIQEEIEHILAYNLGTDATRCIQLSELQLSPDIVLKGVGRMEELRCLIVNTDRSETDDYDLYLDWEFDGDTQYLPNALRFLQWAHYPFLSLPVTFQANNIVTIEMPDSSITQLWIEGERRVLNNLRFLNLSRSMLTTLDLELTPRLEWLELKECRGLVDLLMPVGSPTRLVHLDVIGCSSFDSFSFIKRLESLSLSKLHLIVVKSQQECLRFRSKLEFTCLYSEEQSSFTENRQKSVSLNLKSSTKLESVSESICGLQHLKHLTLDGCLPELPNDLDRLQYLEKLNLLSTGITCLPDSICMLKLLKSLKLESCSGLERLPDALGGLQCLEKLTLSSSKIRRLPDSLCSLGFLKSLKLKSCSLLARLPESLGQLQCLEKLNLLSAPIKSLPDSICMLERLKALELEKCRFLEKLPENLGWLERLEKLILTECTSLEGIPGSICEISNLKCFLLPFCDLVKELPKKLGDLPRLKELNVNGTGISHLPQSISWVRGLRVIGSIAVLQSCGYKSEIHSKEGETFCYINPPQRESPL